MTTHELAQQLLAGPNVEVRVPSAWHYVRYVDESKPRWAQPCYPAIGLKQIAGVNIVYIVPSDANIPEENDVHCWPYVKETK